MAPADELECRQMLSTGITLGQPAAVRYPRGAGPGVVAGDTLEPIPVGKAEVRREGSKVAILAFGAMVPTAETVAPDLDATVVNMRFVKPLDEELVLRLARTHRAFVTLEDNAVSGGAGSAVNELLAVHSVPIPILNLGIPDRFIEHGTRAECLAAAGLDAASVTAGIRAWLGETIRFRAGQGA
jgi:1-deoxy-D-xylulose-5-phosphate synthase